jgi:hypothetical protein
MENEANSSAAQPSAYVRPKAVDELFHCPDGCVLTEIYINCNINSKGDQYEDWKHLKSKKSRKLKCFQAINTEDYGHWNYAVMAFAARHGHLKCLESLYKMGASYHADVAIVAKEANQLKCYDFIVKNFSDIFRP